MVGLLVGVFGVQISFAQEQLFTDVSLGNKNYVAIKYLKDNSLVDGYEDGSFKPLEAINRVEALKILLKAISGPTKKNSDKFSFPDVKISDWFYPYVEDAWHNYLIKGYPDGLFHPEKTINRAESLKIALQQEGKKVPTGVSSPPYADVPIDSWYAPYAQISKERTLFLESRKNGGLNADTSMDRGEFANLIYRITKSQKGARFARATWYGDLLGNQGTASGEPYIPNHFTAAHKTLPFGTKLLVTNLANGKKIEVTVNDRGPYATGVDLDLSRSAFEAIASIGAGIIETEFEEISPETTTNESTNPPAYGF